MATKSKLAEAIEKQAKNLDDAQRELVLSQFRTYSWNLKRMRELETRLALLGGKDPSEYGKVTNYIQLRKSLASERNSLATANNSIASKLFMQLRGTGDDTDEFDDFMKD